MAQKNTAAIRRHLSRKCAALGVPVSGTFELTPRCNLQCPMCYIRLTPAEMAPLGKELTASQWLELGRQARDAGMAFLLITGGEPTLRTDFCEIYSGLMELGLSITINTNGTALSPALRQLWHRLPPAYVNVTLYGASPEDYQTMCGDASAFNRVMEALNWLKNEGILVHLNTTISPANVHRWQQIEDLAKELGFDLRLTAYCFPPARRDGCSDCTAFNRLPPKEAAKMIVQDLLYREGMDAVILRARNLDAPPKEDCAIDIGEPMYCLAGRSQFWIDWKGDMVPCGMMTAPVVKPLEQDFQSAWDDLRGKTSHIRLCPDCVTCKDRQTCMNCAAVIFTETGSFTKKPEYMCQLNREYRALLQDTAKDQ